MLDSAAFRQLLESLALQPSHDPSNDLVRAAVQMRARDACEYCLMPTRGMFHLDHIVPISRWKEYLTGGLLVHPINSAREPDHLDYFAWSCAYCNESKGNRVSGRVGRRSFRLFHPRRDRWDDHFFFVDGHLHIAGATDTGEATEQVLAFNSGRRGGPAAARHRAILDGIYPPSWARGWGF